MIFTASPVRGLRPVRALRACFSKVPKPLMATLSPLATVKVIISTMASTATVACRFPPRRVSRASTSSALFTGLLLLGRGCLSFLPRAEQEPDR